MYCTWILVTIFIVHEILPTEGLEDRDRVTASESESAEWTQHDYGLKIESIRLGKQHEEFNDQRGIIKANEDLIPVKAPPELVLSIAMESAINQAIQPPDQMDEIDKKYNSRSGDYWNAVWKEEVDPKILRNLQKKRKQGSVKTKIMPGTKLYQLISLLKPYSPRLLYVINN